MGAGGKLEEQAVLAAQELFALGEGVVLAADGVFGEQGLAGLAGGERGERVDAAGSGGGAFVRGEIADQVCAAAENRLASLAGIMAEGVLLEGIDFVADEAGDHGCVLGLVWRACSRLHARDGSMSAEP
ncbi:MAG: hypothetical protein WEA77_03005 [Hyphomonas sp.]